MLTTSSPCPCSSGSTFDQCCGPFLAGTAYPNTSLLLMRSRYSAFVTGNSEYLLQTWAPRTRPQQLSFDPAVQWTGLEIVHTEAGSPFHDTGIVEFIATYSIQHPSGTQQLGQQHERSKFIRHLGRWVYLDGELDHEH